MGDRPVSVTEFLRALLMVHAENRESWDEATREWPVPAFRQTADQWLAEIEPLVPRIRTLFLGLAATVLSLVDPDVARAAERSAVLWDVARRIHPDAGEFLSPAGLRLLQRRAPLTAFGLDLLPAAIELKGRLDEGAATSLAVADQAQAPAGTIADWAAAFPGGVYLGRGTSSSKVADKEPVADLGWSRGGRLHVVRGGARGVGLLRIDPRSRQQAPQQDWPTAAHAAVTDGFIALVQDDGRLVHWGVTDGGGPLPVPTTGVATRSPASPWRASTSACWTAMGSCSSAARVARGRSASARSQGPS